jgi:hypothetical protein
VKHLIIYGVFDTWARGKPCVMVGSTTYKLYARAQGYKNYKWYESDRHEHRALWEGDVEEDSLTFVRAAKEAAWIGRMKTWYDQGGKNQMNPVIHALGNPNFFTEISRIGLRRVRELYPNLARENGFKYGHLGGRKRFELHGSPATFEGRSKGGKSGAGGRAAAGTTVANGYPERKNCGLAAMHVRWHEKRGIKNPNCKFCQEGT